MHQKCKRKIYLPSGKKLLTILLWNKTDLDWRQIHYIKERLRSIYLHTFILPSIVTIKFYFPYPWYSEFGKSCFGFTFKIHNCHQLKNYCFPYKSVPLQLGHFFFINKIDKGHNIKNMKPLLGGVTVLSHVLQCIAAMLFHLLSLEVQKMFSNKHFVTM